jgi:nitrogen-specific signal transduction histidine kinase
LFLNQSLLGKGIDATIVEQLFEPFFTKRAKGTELGLVEEENSVAMIMKGLQPLFGISSEPEMTHIRRHEAGLPIYPKLSIVCSDR